MFWIPVESNWPLLRHMRAMKNSFPLVFKQVNVDVLIEAMASKPSLPKAAPISSTRHKALEVDEIFKVLR